MGIIRTVIALLPFRWQIMLKQLRFAWRIGVGQFETDEPEFKWIEQVVRPGDTIIDIGASVGVYTRKFASLVGPSGRVVAFEPVPESFYLLTTNVGLYYKNITLLNMAVSDRIMIASMTIPYGENYLRNYYRASIVDMKVDEMDKVDILCFPLDLMNFPSRIRLIKIDVEGYESKVINGMKHLIERDKPILIIESISSEICEWLKLHGYSHLKLPTSPNSIFIYESE